MIISFSIGGYCCQGYYVNNWFSTHWKSHNSVDFLKNLFKIIVYDCLFLKLPLVGINFYLLYAAIVGKYKGEAFTVLPCSGNLSAFLDHFLGKFTCFIIFWIIMR